MGFGIWPPRLVFLFVILGYLATVQAEDENATPSPEVVRRHEQFDACVREWTISTGRKCDETRPDMLRKQTINKYNGSEYDEGTWIFMASKNELKEIYTTACGIANDGYECKNESCVCLGPAISGPIGSRKTECDIPPHTQN